MKIKMHIQIFSTLYDKHKLLFSWQHANVVMVAMGGLAFLLAVIPFKFFLMGLIVQSFTMNLKTSNKSNSGTGNRRLKEWWDTIPIVPIRVVDNAPNTQHAK
jgi:hypothetical protein